MFFKPKQIRHPEQPTCLRQVDGQMTSPPHPRMFFSSCSSELSGHELRSKLKKSQASSTPCKWKHHRYLCNPERSGWTLQFNQPDESTRSLPQNCHPDRSELERTFCSPNPPPAANGSITVTFVIPNEVDGHRTSTNQYQLPELSSWPDRSELDQPCCPPNPVPEENEIITVTFVIPAPQFTSGPNAPPDPCK
jgi:hypothetical protein